MAELVEMPIKLVCGMITLVNVNVKWIMLLNSVSMFAPNLGKNSVSTFLMVCKTLSKTTAKLLCETVAGLTMMNGKLVVNNHTIVSRAQITKQMMKLMTETLTDFHGC